LTQGTRRNLRPISQGNAQAITAVIADDHELFRGGLRDILEEDGVRVVGEAADGEGALELVAELGPDVVVMDLNMPGMGGVEAIRRMIERVPSTRVLVLTISARRGSIDEALAAGAVGHLLKDATVEEIAAAVRATAAGEAPAGQRPH
jgi:DNA-binding NarL/FixJ family response regulator